MPGISAASPRMSFDGKEVDRLSVASTTTREDWFRMRRGKDRPHAGDSPGEQRERKGWWKGKGVTSAVSAPELRDEGGDGRKSRAG